MTAPSQDLTMPRRSYSYTRISTGVQAHGGGIHRQDGFAEQISAKKAGASTTRSATPTAAAPVSTAPTSSPPPT